MLKGTLDDFTLPDVFKFLSSVHKTGIVEVARSAGEGRVFFREGEVYHAESNLNREPIGQKLVRSRLIHADDLQAALEEQSGSGKRLGEILVAVGKISQEQIEGVVRQQIEDAVFDLLRWELGEFTFHADEEMEVEVPLSVSVDNLIMEASRKLEEFEVIISKIPSELAIPVMAPAPPEGAAEINITPEEWRILVLVNGYRTVAEIAEAVGLDNFSTMRTLFGLASTGLIEVVEEAEVEVPTLSVVEPDPEPEPIPESEPEPIRVEEAVEVIPDGGAEDEIGSDAVPELLEAESLTEDTVYASLTEEKPSAFDELAALETEPADPFASELLSDEPQPRHGDTQSEEISLNSLASELDIDPEEEAIPASSVGEQPTVDRLAAVRELADLFEQTESENENENVGGGPPYAAEIAAAQAAAEGEEVPESDGRRRVEDDEEITRGLISRLIDGVKGL